jgi:exodeoxyribonuclease V alpha subunit
MTQQLLNAKRLTLTVTRINFESDSFTVFEGMPARSNTKVTVTTNMQVRAGCKVVADGQFVNHPKFGRQFKATTLVAYLPDRKEELMAYFSSGGVPGIGKQLALELVREFGERTLAVIEDEPWRLKTVKGIGPDRAASIQEVVKRERSYANLLKVLEPLEIDLAQAALIHRKFGADSVEAIKAPWKIREAGGISDHTIDQLATIAPEKNSGAIIADRLERTLTRLMNLGGHTALPIEALEAHCESDEQLATICKERADLKASLADTSVFFTHDGKEFLTTRSCYARDKWIADQFDYRNSQPDHGGFKELSSVVQRLIPEQKTPYAGLCANPNSLLIGPPGTGKTYMIDALVKTALAHDPSLKIRLAAPTAKAASRLTEAVGIEATTIHRLLGSRGPQGWTHHFRNQLDCDLLIIDELSMVDAYLFAAILAATPAQCALLLAGDGGQIKSVGQGNIIRDLTQSKIIPIVELTEPVRFDSRSPITLAAQDALQAQPLSLPAGEPNQDTSFQIQSDSAADLVETLVRIVESMSVQERLQTRIVSPFRAGMTGIQNLNTIVQPFMNPIMAAGKRAQELDFLCEKDRVIVTRNLRDLSVFNGQNGYVSKVHNDNTCTVSLAGKSVLFTQANMKHLELGYVTTFHKMQGSEAEVVIVVLPNDKAGFVSREMVNTAITRARSKVIVLTEKDSFLQAANVSSSDRCHTTLSYLLTNKDDSQESGG